MKNRGFTLIEIIVAMAILSIMAGTLVPMLYKTWESNEIAVTRGRMSELKKAMVGDRALVQQGIRTHYGFVGDNGVLPAGIQDLVTDFGTFANWNGPYLGGFDPGTYASDAWGNDIVFARQSPPLIVSGMSVLATLRSAGPDRTFGTGDDIDENSALELQIIEDDVWPTRMVQGNLTYTFTASEETIIPSNSYWTELQAEYRDSTGTRTTFTCIPFSGGTALADIPTTFSEGFDDNFGEELPVGPVVLRSRLFNDSSCTIPPLGIAGTNNMTIFVSDGISKIYVNPPTLYYTIP
jgi:general secretion pathway protein G